MRNLYYLLLSNLKNVNWYTTFWVDSRESKIKHRIKDLKFYVEEYIRETVYFNQLFQSVAI